MTMSDPIADMLTTDTVKDEMQATKELWEKTGGRTYKHRRAGGIEYVYGSKQCGQRADALLYGA